MSGHRLFFGGLDIVAANGGYDEGYWFQTMVNGFSWGTAEAVKVVVASLMRDGSDSRIDHYENRFLTLTVRVYGATSGVLDAGGEALELLVGGRTELSWTPPDGIGGTTVFDVLNSTLDFQWSDVAEAQDGVKWRDFALTLECLPFGRPPDLVSVTFAIATPTFSDIADGSSTTGWTIPAGGDIAPGVISTTTHLGSTVIKRTKTGTGQPAIQFAGTWGPTPYVAFDVDVVGQDFPSTNVLYTAAGFQFPLAQEMRSSGYMRLYFDNPGVTANLQFGLYDTPFVDIYTRIYGATSLPTAGILSADIEGSVRTEGTVVVEAASALGDAMAFFDPKMAEFGYIPDNKDSWKNCPEGTYEVYLKETATSHAVGSEISVTVGSQTVKTIVEYGSADATYVPVGKLALGGLRSGRAGTFTLTAAVRPWSGSSFSGPTNITPTASIRLFRVAPEASLTFARGMTKKRLLIDIPSLQYARGGVWAGDAADGSDAASVLDACDAWDYPTLTPGRTGIYVRATPAAPTVTATYPPRVRTFAPKAEA